MFWVGVGGSGEVRVSLLKCPGILNLASNAEAGRNLFKGYQEQAQSGGEGSSMYSIWMWNQGQ